MEITNEMAEAAKQLSDEGAAICGEAMDKLRELHNSRGYSVQQSAQVFAGFQSALAGSMCAAIGPSATKEIMMVIAMVVVGVAETRKPAGESVH